MRIFKKLRHRRPWRSASAVTGLAGQNHRHLKQEGVPSPASDSTRVEKRLEICSEVWMIFSHSFIKLYLYLMKLSWWTKSRHADCILRIQWSWPSYTCLVARELFHMAMEFEQRFKGWIRKVGVGGPGRGVGMGRNPVSERTRCSEEIKEE